MSDVESRAYWRIRGGDAAKYAELFHEKGIIGLGWHDVGDLSQPLAETKLNGAFLDILKQRYARSAYGKEGNVVSGYAVGQIYFFCRDIKPGDIVFMPVKRGAPRLWAGKVTGDYYFDAQNGTKGYFHCRKTEWLKEIPAAALSPEFRRVLNTPKTLINISHYAEEIENILKAPAEFYPFADDEPALAKADSEAPLPENAFELETHLEDFLVKNWRKTEFGKKYDIYKIGDDIVGKQYQTEAGIMDILARSKNGRELLVIELKRGRTSDKVIGQVLRYMGYAQKHLAEQGQKVRGCIIALEEDSKLQYALSLIENLVEFYCYKVDFELIKKRSS